MSLPYEYRDIKDELSKLNDLLDIVLYYLKGNEVKRKC